MKENRLNTKLSRVDEAIGTLRQKLKLNENDPVEKVIEKSDIKNHLNIFIQDTEPETKEGILIDPADDAEYIIKCILEKEINVKAIALHDEETNRNTQRAKTIDAQFKELKKLNAQRTKAITPKKQR